MSKDELNDKQYSELYFDEDAYNRQKRIARKKFCNDFSNTTTTELMKHEKDKRNRRKEKVEDNYKGIYEY